MKKRILTLLAAVCLLSAVLSGCGGGSQTGTAENTDQSTTSTPADGPEARAAAGELNVGIAQDLDSSLDPHKTVKAGTREVMFNVFEGLLKPDASGNLNPAVAESYTVSDDHLLYTFKLRPGVKFHNGQDVTPEDVIWSYQRCAEPDSADIIQVAAFAGVEMYAEGDDTVCFRLKEPNNEFTSYLTTAILPKDYIEQDTQPVGTGPFRFVSRTAQESVVLERFDDYWGTKPDLTRVTYKIIENSDSILLSLQSGAVDVFAHLTTTQIAQLGDGFHVEEGTMNLVQALYLNNAEKPFDDVRVRQALCYAVDRQQILELAFDGYGTLLGSSMYPAFSKYFDDSLTNTYEYNTEKAKALLAEAGYPNGFEFTLDCPNNRYINDEAIGKALAGMWAKIGVKVKVNAIPRANYFPKVLRYDSSVGMVGWGASTQDALFPLQSLVETVDVKKGNGLSNIGRVSDPELDALIEKIKEEENFDKRNELIEQALLRVNKNIYVLPLHTQVINWALKKNIDAPLRADDRLELDKVVVK